MYNAHRGSGGPGISTEAYRGLFHLICYGGGLQSRKKDGEGGVKFQGFKQGYIWKKRWGTIPSQAFVTPPTPDNISNGTALIILYY